MSVLDDLKVAKAQMVERGRCTDELVDEHGRVCLVGAIGIATIGEPSFVYEHDLLLSNPRVKAATVELSKHVTLPPGVTCIGLGVLTYFNDHESTTTQDVLDLFDKAIANLGGMA